MSRSVCEHCGRAYQPHAEQHGCQNCPGSLRATVAALRAQLEARNEQMDTLQDQSDALSVLLCEARDERDAKLKRQEEAHRAAREEQERAARALYAQLDEEERIGTAYYKRLEVQQVELEALRRVRDEAAALRTALESYPCGCERRCFCEHDVAREAALSGTAGRALLERMQRLEAVAAAARALIAQTSVSYWEVWSTLRDDLAALALGVER